MPKVKGRKQRKLRKDRINFLMSLCPKQHQQLKRLAEHRQETIALIIERYLEYMLLGEVAKLDRQQEQQRMAVAVWCLTLRLSYIRRPIVRWNR